MDAGQMLKKEAKRCFLQQTKILVLCHGGMSYLNVVKRVSLSNQKWVMQCYFGA